MEKMSLQLERIINCIKDSKTALIEKDLKPPVDMHFTDIDEVIDTYDLEYLDK